MLDQATKPWWASKTVWAGAATIGGGIASAAYAYFWQHDSAQAIAELLGLLTTGGGAIYGRLTATQKVGA